MIPITKFGKDHWSTFAYLETRVVDYKGVPDMEHMRVDTDRHPFQANTACRFNKEKYPTKLFGWNRDEPLKNVQANHDDWDCLEDLEAEGLLENIGTGVNPVVKLTERGELVAGWLRSHKASGGTFSTFKVR